MTRAQYTVIWIGLVLVAFNLIIHVSDVKGILFGGTPSGSSSSSTSNNSSGSQTPTPTPNASPTPPNVQAV